MKSIESQDEGLKGSHIGWICPLCSAAHSPAVETCPRATPSKSRYLDPETTDEADAHENARRVRYAVERLDAAGAVEAGPYGPLNLGGRIDALFAELVAARTLLIRLAPLQDACETWFAILFGEADQQKSRSSADFVLRDAIAAARSE